MKTDTSQKIIDYTQKQGQVTAKELVDYLGFSYTAVFKQLKKLTEKELLAKIGKPPKVFYFLAQKKEPYNAYSIDPKIEKIIEENFLFVTPLGQVKEGIEGFYNWCHLREQPVEKTAQEYVKTLKKYQVFKKQGFIDGLKKAKSTFDKVALNQLFYLDFYSIERFGKTKLGQQLLYAKQSQDRGFIKVLTQLIEPKVEALLKLYKIDAIAFVPPTVRREVQFMKELQKHLKLNLPMVKLTKVRTQILVPQKTLNKLSDRIQNAQKTIVVEGRQPYKTVLVIDDAVGSGATINETARQLKQRGVAKKVIGLAITGSFKGFEVISEV